MTTILHDPRAGLTETHRKAAAAAIERKRRLNGIPAQERAARSVQTAACMAGMVEALQVEIESPPSAPGETWEERQARRHSLPADPSAWFAIVNEVDPKPRAPRIEEIQAACAKHYQVRKEDILSARRTANVVRPRQVGYYLSKMLTPKSLPEIGRRFGGRDHTSALSGIRKIGRLRKIDADLESDLHAIAAAVGGSLAEAS